MLEALGLCERSRDSTTDRLKWSELIKVVCLDRETTRFALVRNHTTRPSAMGVVEVDSLNAQLKNLVLVEDLSWQINHRDPSIIEYADVDFGDSDIELGAGIKGDFAGGFDGPDHKRVGIGSDPEGKRFVRICRFLRCALKVQLPICCRIIARWFACSSEESDRCGLGGRLCIAQRTVLDQ